jgi:hypothetical protein
VRPPCGLESRNRRVGTPFIALCGIDRANGSHTSGASVTLLVVSSLRLFEIDAPAAIPPPEQSQPQQSETREQAMHASERYLAEHIERYGDLAIIQAVLCFGAEIRGGNLDELDVDRAKYPRCAAAVDRVVELLAADVDDLPDGFWPRFLLKQLQST